MPTVVVAGSRSISDYEPVRKALDESPFKIDKILHGGAHGVDMRAMDYALFNSIDVEVVRPDYDEHGSRAPLVRNREMLKKADALIAVWDGESTGTKYTMDKASTYGMKKIGTMGSWRGAEIHYYGTKQVSEEVFL